MNLATGIFTAPQDGVYRFAFSGMKDRSGNTLYVQLRLKGNVISTAYGPYDSNAVSSSIQSTLQLEKGDQVDLWLEDGTLYDTAWHYTSFSGWLVEEDIEIWYIQQLDFNCSHIIIASVLR